MPFGPILRYVLFILTWMVSLENFVVNFQGIEYLKTRERFHREHKSFLSSMENVFGGPMSLTWFNPYSKPIYFRTENDERVTLDV